MSSQDAAIQTSRPFTLLERYCLTRELIGFPPHLTAIVTYPRSSLPCSSFLEERIVKLQEHFPALYARVVNRRTTRPEWAVGDLPWPADTILGDVEIGKDETVESVIKREMEQFAGVSMDQGVYWNVRRYCPSGSSHAGSRKRDGEGNGYVTLSTSHTLMDGRAMLATLQALLAPDAPTTSEPAISIPLDGQEFSPGLAEVVPLVWSNLIQPRLPLWIQHRLPSASPPWPLIPGDIKGAILDCPGDISYLSISSALSDRIKGITKEHKASLQIVLKVAFLMAMWKVLRPEGEALQLSGVTPRDDRNLPSHSRITGTFASATTLSSSFSSTTPFWELVQSWTAVLRDPGEPARARRKIGVLSYIPDPPDYTSEDPRRCTGWEDFWLDKIEGKGGTPTGDSFEPSNLGATKLPPGATDLAWLQPPNPIGAAIRAGIVGHPGGLRYVLVWREGYCVTREQVMRIQEKFVLVLERVVEGGKETTGELTE